MPKKDRPSPLPDSFFTAKLDVGDGSPSLLEEIPVRGTFIQFDSAEGCSGDKKTSLSTAPAWLGASIQSILQSAVEIDDPLPSIGSAKHDEGACKRCCFFPKGRCTNGQNCEFCHFDHEKRKRKKKKKGAGSKKKDGEEDSDSEDGDSDSDPAPSPRPRARAEASLPAARWANGAPGADGPKWADAATACSAGGSSSSRPAKAFVESRGAVVTGFEAAYGTQGPPTQVLGPPPTAPPSCPPRGLPHFDDASRLPMYDHAAHASAAAAAAAAATEAAHAAQLDAYYAGISYGASLSAAAATPYDPSSMAAAAAAAALAGSQGAHGLGGHGPGFDPYGYPMGPDPRLDPRLSNPYSPWGGAPHGLPPGYGAGLPPNLQLQDHSAFGAQRMPPPR